MNKAAVYHVPEGTFAYAVGSNCLRVRIRLAKGDISECNVIYKNIYDHGSSYKKAAMDKIAWDEVNEWYEADLELPVKSFKYYFRFITRENEEFYYTPDGISEIVSNPPVYFFYPYLFDEEIPSSPTWARGGLIYQVFVDRFCNGDVSNDPAGVRTWGELPDHKTFYGGDFAGLKLKLGYIVSLGTSILYLNPVFLSDTYHKYDIKDYYALDPAYGSPSELKEVVEEAHRLGIKVILDAVFNHCSDKNPLFKDVIENGEASRYASWFCIKSFPIVKNPPNYECFAGEVPEMPKLNTSNPEVQEYLISSAEYWTEYLGIDGWRLDVADEVSHLFWKVFRNRMKKISPDILILGEIWNRAAQWLNGDECDSSTNYRFRKLLIDFANHAEMTNEQFWNGVAKNDMNYKTGTIPFLVNLVGSHDTKRIINAVGGNSDMTRLVLGVMLTFTGIALIYYGDEIGMHGEDDPDNRRSMFWNEDTFDMETLYMVRTLGNARRKYEAFMNGLLVPDREAPAKVLAYTRITDKGESVYIAANFGTNEERVCFYTGNNTTKTYKNLLNDPDKNIYAVDCTGVVEIELPSGVIAVLVGE